MSSNINAAIPTSGSNLSATPIRNNFQAAKEEIEELQAVINNLEIPGGLGTASAADVEDFATAAQGELADSSLQEGDIGVIVQGYDVDLTALAGLSTTGLIERTGSGTAGIVSITTAGKNLLDDANTTTQRTTLGLGSAATAASTDFATATQGSKADTAIQPNTATQLGGVDNYINIANDGTLTLIGDATVWDDITPGIAAAKTSGPGVSLNLTEMTLDFVSTADLNDYSVIPFQLSHKIKAGSSIYPHIHWEQAHSTFPNWLFQYRWQRNGQPKTTSWTNLKCDQHVYTYTSGTLNQINYSAAITAPANYSMSDILQLRVLRDCNNTSGLFTGSDPYTGTVSITSFDPHVEIDSLGSKTEFVK